MEATTCILSGTPGFSLRQFGRILNRTNPLRPRGGAGDQADCDCCRFLFLTLTRGRWIPAILNSTFGGHICGGGKAEDAMSRSVSWHIWSILLGTSKCQMLLTFYEGGDDCNVGARKPNVLMVNDCWPSSPFFVQIVSLDGCVRSIDDRNLKLVVLLFL